MLGPATILVAAFALVILLIAIAFRLFIWTVIGAVLFIAACCHNEVMINAEKEKNVSTEVQTLLQENERAQEAPR